jgi:hypothetical protein
MAEFLSSYGLWIVLAVIMIGMHWFGMGCCGGVRRHGSGADSASPFTGSSENGKAHGTSPKAGGCCR